MLFSVVYFQYVLSFAVDWDGQDDYVDSDIEGAERNEKDESDDSGSESSVSESSDRKSEEEESGDEEDEENGSCDDRCVPYFVIFCAFPV